MKHRFVRRASALALAGCLLAGSSLPALQQPPLPRKRSFMQTLRPPVL